MFLMGNLLFFFNIYGHDFITGHSGGVSSSCYIEGHSLERRKEAIDKVNNVHGMELIISYALAK